jgi:hypothetical protein
MTPVGPTGSASGTPLKTFRSEIDTHRDQRRRRRRRRRREGVY